MIAALFVQKNGVYFGLDGVDPYDVKRNAMTYHGDMPVVAHPPCARWCRLAGLVEARWGYKVGDDGGMFEFALATVRRCGGVLEHPAYSKAWDRFSLPKPPRVGGWIAGAGGFSCHVEQGRYGHPAKKATWLFAVSSSPLPEMSWGSTPDSDVRSTVSWCGNNTKKHPRGTRPRVGKDAASRTPIEFRDVLMTIARESRT